MAERGGEGRQEIDSYRGWGGRTDGGGVAIILTCFFPNMSWDGMARSNCKVLCPGQGGRKEGAEMA